MLGRMWEETFKFGFISVFVPLFPKYQSGVRGPRGGF